MSNIQSGGAVDITTNHQPAGGLYLDNDMVDAGTGNIKVLFDTVLADFIDGIEDIPNSKIIVTETGWYSIIAQVRLQDVPDSELFVIQIVKAGITWIAERRFHSGKADILTPGIDFIAKLTAGDSIDLRVTIATATVDIAQGSNDTFLIVQRIR